jgi:hypothetical protein
MDAILESRTGKLFIIAYTLFAIGMYIVSFTCGTEACGLYIVVPIMPWALIFAEDFGLSFPWAIYPIFVLLNASVAYVVGAGLEWSYHWYQERREDVRQTSDHKASV